MTMNRTIKLLVLSDIFVLTGFGLINPILAIFIKDNLIGGSIFAAGLASTIFLVTKSVIQLPFSRYVDLHDDKVKWLILGTFLVACVPFVYIFTNHINYIYIAQFMYGVGGGLAYPTWLGLFSTHLDKKHESFEWSMYSTSICLGTAATGSIGAILATYFGFNLTFLIVGLMSFTGCFILLGLEMKRVKLGRVKLVHYHRKRKSSHRE
jgi:MFS family permease